MDSMPSSFTTLPSDHRSCHENLGSYRFALAMTALLFASGMLHAAIYAIQGASWEGPLSLRKPILFGISGGMTVLSITWLMTQLRRQKFDRWIANAFAFALFVEVGLITLQYWRGQASHFNHSTVFDMLIELSMLGLILFATAQLMYLTVRTVWLRDIDPGMAVAIRGGMCLLLLSCGLGIATSVLGEINISAGRSAEYWGTAGVLKFPHGAALHAIQLLPLIAWFARYVGAMHRGRMVRFALGSQVVFLVYSGWQTSRGLGRFEWNTVGVCILACSLFLGMLAALPLFRGLFAKWFHGEKR
jgi:hypothetical protein